MIDELDPEALAIFINALERHDMSAIRYFNQLMPQFRHRLPDNAVHRVARACRESALQRSRAASSRRACSRRALYAGNRPAPRLNRSESDSREMI